MNSDAQKPTSEGASKYVPSGLQGYASATDSVDKEQIAKGFQAVETDMTALQAQLAQLQDIVQRIPGVAHLAAEMQRVGTLGKKEAQR